MAPDAPIDNMIILATQVSTLRRAGPALGRGDAQVPGPEDRLVRGRHRLDPVLPGPLRPALHQPALARATTSAASCPATSSASTRWPATSPTRRRSRSGTTSGSTSSRGSATTPTRTAIWPNAPEFAHAEMAGAGVPDEEVHKILWQNTYRFFGRDPFQHIAKEDATVGALRALSPDVDTDDPLQARVAPALRQAEVHRLTPLPRPPGSGADGGVRDLDQAGAQLVRSAAAGHTVPPPILVLCPACWAEHERPWDGMRQAPCTIASSTGPATRVQHAHDGRGPGPVRHGDAQAGAAAPAEHEPRDPGRGRHGRRRRARASRRRVRRPDPSRRSRAPARRGRRPP